MGFYICNGNGESATSPSIAAMRAFLDGLDPEDEEHGAAWIADDEGNALEYEVGGNLCFSRGDHARHLSGVSKETCLQLWIQLVDGRFDEIERQPWQPGTRPPMSPEERAVRERLCAEAELIRDREFYDALGLERSAIPCRRAGCTRGAVSLSAFCKRHHFESIHGRGCPFED